MLCQRALEILNSMKNKQDVPMNAEELDIMRGLNAITLFESDRTVDTIGNDMADVKIKYDTTAELVRRINKDLLGVERQIATSAGARLAASLKLGSAHKRATQLKREMGTQETLLNDIKKKMLDLNLEKETVERAVRINGHRAFLTPVGEQLSEEINARQRFMPRDLATFNQVLQRLDNTFSASIAKIDSMLKSGT
nr:hypothetical protein [Candidatus Sigynarchaeota archaeon]